MTVVLKLARKSIGLLMLLSATALTAGAGADPPTSCASVPEIDPGSVLSAVTLLTGGLMVMTDRKKAEPRA